MQETINTTTTEAIDNPTEAFKAPSLDNLQQLLSPPEIKGISPKTQELLKDASVEITALLRKPVEMANTSCQELAQTHPEMAKVFRTERDLGTEALQFLDGFCANLNMGPKDYVNLKITEEPEGGIRMTVSPKEQPKNLGKIGSDTIKKVELIIRTGEKTNNQTFTPMQLNWRISDEYDQLIRSLRVDLHSINMNTVQVDAVTGGEYSSLKHIAVKSLSGEDSQPNFRQLQRAVLINIVDNIGTQECGERIEVDATSTKLLTEHYLAARKDITTSVV